jgi:hypothetical protein
MAIPITDATDINTLLDFMMGRTRPYGGAVTADEATAAARRLVAKANRALSAGLTPGDVNLTGELAPGQLDGAMPTEIDGMPVRAAFPTPPEGDDCLEQWTVIVHEASGPGGGTYRLCRVRRAGAPGQWEVFDCLPGAQDLTWMLAAEWFARAVQVEVGSAEPPLQDDRHLPR